MGGVTQVSGLGRAVELGSAGALALAVIYATVAVSDSTPGALVAGAAAFMAANLALARVDGEPRLRLPDFALAAMELDEGDSQGELLLTNLAELLLTDVAAESADADELLLEDRLDAPDPRSRVIRLFDPRSFPAVREADGSSEPHPPGLREVIYPDATSELHKALAALRGSLR